MLFSYLRQNKPYKTNTFFFVGDVGDKNNNIKSNSVVGVVEIIHDCVRACTYYVQTISDISDNLYKSMKELTKSCRRCLFLSPTHPRQSPTLLILKINKAHLNTHW